jgi:AmmeMemoRadiSam system protein A
MMRDAERQHLLSMARSSIAAHLAGEVRPPAPLSMGTKAGAFVTLHRGSELRGCIGHVEADQLLEMVVPRMAVAACSGDPRFPPVTAEELPVLTIEISVLSRLESITGAHDIGIGRHGLVVEHGGHRGLLLPQVAVENGWTPEEFAAQTCRKAGLLPDAWRLGARLWRFEAEVFGENSEEVKTVKS